MTLVVFIFIVYLKIYIVQFGDMVGDNLRQVGKRMRKFHLGPETARKV